MLLSPLNFRWLAWIVLMLLASIGCRPQDEIARYTVPKPERIDPTLAKAAATERQMLGAIVLVDKAGWFFKLTGDKAHVAPLAEPFISFVKDLKFEGSPSQPKWQVPAGWKERPGNEFRFATLEIPSDGKVLELTVSTLEMAEVNEQDYLLANINRWRGQLGLSDLRASDLATETISSKVDDHPGTFINIVGTGSGSMAGGPFAGGGAPFHAPSASSAPGQPQWTKPDGWTEIPPKTFGIAAFTVGEPPQQIEITLSSAGGDWMNNVNRWRGQVSLPPVGPDEIAKEARQIDVLGVQGNYVQLTGTSDKYGPTTLFGIAATARGTQYFIKLIGDTDIAEREKDNFEAFVQSLKME